MTSVDRILSRKLRLCEQSRRKQRWIILVLEINHSGYEDREAKMDYSSSALKFIYIDVSNANAWRAALE